MKIQIRLAESGHSHCYQNVPNMEFLMQEIKRDFKIQINNQKILNKSSELMKKQTNFDSVKQHMKKTISSQNNHLNNNLSEFNNQKKQNADREILQCPCLYVYNQKQLLKPIQYTDSKDKEYFLGVLTKKMEEMMSLREQPYELNQIKERIVKNHLQEAVQYVSKKHKTIQKNLNIYEKYKNFLESAQNCKELDICVGELTNLCESQCKAGKTIIRSINVINHQKCKRKLENITKKLESIKKYSLPSQDQMNFKQNSIYFNSNKKLSIQALSSILSQKEVLDKKFIQGQQKYKKAKKTYVVQKYKFGQKKCYQISISLQKLKHTLQEISMQLKHSYKEFFEQLQKFVKKQIKQSMKLVLILQKISTDEQKINTILQKITQFYLQLSQIHSYNEKVQIKQVYAAYVGLRKYFDEFQDEIKDLQREIYRYMKQIEQKQKCQKEQKGQKLYEVDEFISSQTIEDKEKQNQRDNKKQKISSPKKDSTLKEKQKQNNLPKMMSNPSKKKIAKNNIKFLSQECIQNKSKNKSKNQVQIQQIDKRLFFNRRIKNIMTFCQNLREDQQKRRKKYKDNNKFYEIINMNKEKERQSSQILKNTTTPIFVMDYDSTTDQNLESLRKILLNQNQKLKQFFYSPQANIYTWQEEIINTISCVNLQLNVFIATAKIDESARQNHLKKLLQLSTGLITKMCKKKLFYQKEEFIKNVNSQYEEQLSKLRKENQSLNFYIVSLKESIQNSDNINQNDRESEEEKQQRDKNESKLSLDRFFQIQKNAKYLSEVNEQVQTQNKLLKDQIVKLNENLFKYQQEIDQITNQLARLEERDQEVQQLKQQLQHEDINKKNIQEEMQKNHYLFENEKAVHLKQVEQLKHHLNMEKQNAFALKKQIKDLNIQLKQMKKFISSHQSILSTLQTLQVEFMSVSNQKQALQEQFKKLKIFLADRQVYIIRLQQIINKNMIKNQFFEVETNNLQKQSSPQQFFDESDPQTIKKLQLQSSFYGQKKFKLSPKKNNFQQGDCQTQNILCNYCSQNQNIISSLNIKNQQLKLQIQSLEMQLRQMLMKQTQEQETQTQMVKGQVNLSNDCFQKKSLLEIKYQSHYYQNYESLDKQNYNKREVNIRNNVNQNQNQHIHEDRIQSQCSYSKIRSFSHMNFANKLTISKSIEDGNLHLFLPFANDIYIGVTIRQDQNNFTNYQQYLNKATFQSQPLFQLDLKSMNNKIKQLLRQSSLVLAVRVSKKQVAIQNSQESKIILVSGKIEYAIGFEDDDMSIKNYAPFLYQ